MKNKQNIITFVGILIISLLVSYATADTMPDIPDSAIFGHVQSTTVFETGDDGAGIPSIDSNESRIMHAYYKLNVTDVIVVSGDATYAYSGIIKRDRGVPVVINTDLDSKGMNLQMENAIYDYAKLKWNATNVKIKAWKPYSKP